VIVLVPNGKTELLGLFGGELDQSPSPATHSAWAEQLNLNWVYLPLPCQSEDHFLSLATQLMSSRLFRGANITNPFKSSALKLPHVHFDSSVKKCGAANTLYQVITPQGSSQWRLANTDLDGCLSALRLIFQSKLESGFANRHVQVVILGRGAMMKTYSAALELFFENKSDKPDIEIWGREELTHPCWQEKGKTEDAPVMLLINTLPCGTSDEADRSAVQALLALNSKFQSSRRIFLDVGYLDSQARKTARRLNWHCHGGEGLFDTQARASFKLWTGFDAPNLPAALPQSAE
jgi:shikimate dehydrogenase